MCLSHTVCLKSSVRFLFVILTGKKHFFSLLSLCCSPLFPCVSLCLHPFSFLSLSPFPFIVSSLASFLSHLRSLSAFFCLHHNYPNLLHFPIAFPDNNKTGQQKCKNCAKGYSILSPLVEDHVNESNCILRCEVSQHINTTTNTCDECKEGYLCDGRSEIECEPGTWCSEGTRNFCPAGTFGEVIAAFEETTCKDCVAGRYQLSRGQTFCTKCEAGYFSSDTAQTTSDACKVCTTPGKKELQLLLCVIVFRLQDTCFCCT